MRIWSHALQKSNLNTKGPTQCCAEHPCWWLFPIQALNVLGAYWEASRRRQQALSTWHKSQQQLTLHVEQCHSIWEWRTKPWEQKSGKVVMCVTPFSQHCPLWPYENSVQSLRGHQNETETTSFPPCASDLCWSPLEALGRGGRLAFQASLGHTLHIDCSPQPM